MLRSHHHLRGFVKLVWWDVYCVNGYGSFQLGYVGVGFGGNCECRYGISYVGGGFCGFGYSGFFSLFFGVSCSRQHIIWIIGLFFYCTIHSECGTWHNFKYSWKLLTTFVVVPEVFSTVCWQQLGTPQTPSASSDTLICDILCRIFQKKIAATTMCTKCACIPVCTPLWISPPSDAFCVVHVNWYIALCVRDRHPAVMILIKFGTAVQNLIGWATRCLAENSKISDPLFWPVDRQFRLTFHSPCFTNPWPVTSFSLLKVDILINFCYY
jgi:hypothetical protein